MFTKGKIADRGKIIEIEVAGSRGFEIRLCAAELFVLQFEFNLVDVQLFEQGETLTRRRGVESTGEAVENLLAGLLAEPPR